VIGLTKSFDLREFEEIVERAIRRARSEELRLIGEAVKKLAEYMETGFKATIERIEKIEKKIEKIEERIEEHSKILKEHSKRLEELSRVVGELKVAIESIGRRWG
jgi:methyl-accepting chemotaxis protein